MHTYEQSVQALDAKENKSGYCLRIPFISATQIVVNWRTLYYLAVIAFLVPSLFVLWIAFLGVILIHECAHLWAARRLDDFLADPRITISLFGGRVACGAVDAEYSPQRIGPRFAWVFLAGPLVNLVCTLPGVCFYLAGIPVPLWLTFFSWANFYTFIFNVIPIIPLDGSRALEGFIWGVVNPDRRYLWSARVALVGAGVVLGGICTVLFFATKNNLVLSILLIVSAAFGLAIQFAFYNGCQEQHAEIVAIKSTNL